MWTAKQGEGMVKLLDELSPHTGMVFLNSHLTRFVLSKYSYETHNTVGSQMQFWVPAALNLQGVLHDARPLNSVLVAFSFVPRCMPFLLLPYVTNKKAKVSEY